MFAGCLVILACFQTLVMCHIIFVSCHFYTHVDGFSETNCLIFTTNGLF